MTRPPGRRGRAGRSPGRGGKRGRVKAPKTTGGGICDLAVIAPASALLVVLPLVLALAGCPSYRDKPAKPSPSHAALVGAR